MQLTLTMTSLLGGVLLMLASLDSARAAPNEAKRLITLPLTKVESTTPGLHPQLRLQQHINRSVRRLAQMKRRDPPSSRDLEERLYRRVISLEGDEGSLERRFNRVGVPRRTEARSSHTLEKRFNRHGVHRKASKKPAAGGNNLAANNLKNKKKQGQAAAAPVADVTPANQPSDSDSGP